MHEGRGCGALDEEGRSQQLEVLQQVAHRVVDFGRALQNAAIPGTLEATGSSSTPAHFAHCQCHRPCSNDLPFCDGCRTRRALRCGDLRNWHASRIRFPDATSGMCVRNTAWTQAGRLVSMTIIDPSSGSVRCSRPYRRRFRIPDARCPRVVGNRGVRKSTALQNRSSLPGMLLDAAHDPLSRSDCSPDLC